MISKKVVQTIKEGQKGVGGIWEIRLIINGLAFLKTIVDQLKAKKYSIWEKRSWWA